MAFWISPQARRDLLEIWTYIAEDDDSAADRWYDGMRDHFEALGRSPRIGRRREAWGRGFRSFPAGEYVIVYAVAPPGVQIKRVIHGRRDLPKFFVH